MILDRVEADRGDSVPDEITTKKVFKHLFDPIVWAFGMSGDYLLSMIKLLIKIDLI